MKDNQKLAMEAFVVEEAKEAIDEMTTAACENRTAMLTPVQAYLMLKLIAPSKNPDERRKSLQ